MCYLPGNISPSRGIVEDSATCCEGVPHFMELSAIAIHAFFHRPLFGLISGFHNSLSQTAGHSG